MALYALLRKERISQDVFFAIVQGLSPYHNIKDFDTFIDECEKSGVIQDDSFRIPNEIDCPSEIAKLTFRRFFVNRKSKSTIEVYYRFYQTLVNFIRNKDDDSLEKLLTVYENYKNMLNKAFGCGNNLFQNKRGSRLAVKDFLKNENSDLFKFHMGLRDLNLTLYRRFICVKLS